MLSDSLLKQVVAHARQEQWTEVEKLSTDELRKLLEGAGCYSFGSCCNHLAMVKDDPLHPEAAYPG